MKTLNRTTVRIAAALLTLAVVGISYCALFDPGMPPRIVTLVLCLVGSGFWLDAMRCPHCKKYVLKLHPFAKNAGYCPKCGKLVEYSQKKRKRT